MLFTLLKEGVKSDRKCLQNRLPVLMTWHLKPDLTQFLLKERVRPDLKHLKNRLPGTTTYLGGTWGSARCSCGRRHGDWRGTTRRSPPARPRRLPRSSSTPSSASGRAAAAAASRPPPWRAACSRRQRRGCCWGRAPPWGPPPAADGPRRRPSRRPEGGSGGGGIYNPLSFTWPICCLHSFSLALSLTSLTVCLLWHWLFFFNLDTQVGRGFGFQRTASSTSWWAVKASQPATSCALVLIKSTWFLSGDKGCGCTETYNAQLTPPLLLRLSLSLSFSLQTRTQLLLLLFCKFGGRFTL